MAKPRQMTPAQFNAALTELELNQTSAAIFLQVGLRTCAGWSAGRTRIPRAVQLLLELMIRDKIKPEELV